MRLMDRIACRGQLEGTVRLRGDIDDGVAVAVLIGNGDELRQTSRRQRQAVVGISL